MERKTIGSFVAALRKASGLTQKELAEKLNVSDKSVSRWERDDGAPDLSLIPVIAEIFGVTCDELLRGQRQSPAQQTEQSGGERPHPKTEKQRQRLLAVSMSGYKNHSLVAVGLAVAGLLAAMIGNFGFHRAYLGFLAQALFILAAVICQLIFVNGAFLSVGDEEMAGPEVECFKRSVVLWAQRGISLSVILLAVSLPLMLDISDAYVGLTAESWLLHGASFGLAALLLCGLVCYFLNAALQKRGIYTLPEPEAGVWRHNFRLKRHCVLVLAAVLTVTLLGHAAATGGWDIASIADGTSFADFASFTAYMEQDIPADHSRNNGFDYAPDQAEQVGDVHYYDRQGNEITKEESMTRTLTDRQGNVLCQYIERNQSVWSMRYGHLNGEILPIITYSQQDIQKAQQKMNLINTTFGGVYLVELAAVLLFYFKKRARVLLGRRPPQAPRVG